MNMWVRVPPCQPIEMKNKSEDVCSRCGGVIVSVVADAPVWNHKNAAEGIACLAKIRRTN